MATGGHATGPGASARAGRVGRGLVSDGNQGAELRAWFARAEDPRVADQVAPGWRDDADQPAEERDRSITR
jgi:hypothetical protein